MLWRGCPQAVHESSSMSKQTECLDLGGSFGLRLAERVHFQAQKYSYQLAQTGFASLG
jgi:hypothetical protein